MFDTHCHLDLPHFDEDRPDVIRRARDAGFTHFMIPGIEFATIEKIRTIAEENDGIWFASGIHPNNAADLPEDWDERVKQDALHPKCRAIGEIGLDHYWDDCPHDVQERVFLRQLEIAAELELPAIIHCREAYDDLWPILRDWMKGGSGRKAVLHAFDGDASQAAAAVELGVMIGMGGPYTYRKKNERRIAVMESVPIGSILLETDCPYLSPIPHRGERNEPAYARLTLEKIAEIKNIPFETADRITTENGIEFFGLGG
ncbi:MAG: TatD family hydrolase [Flexilinea sp.]|nr:TatD family hydrolase [Flexilinea sp.]